MQKRLFMANMINRALAACGRALQFVEPRFRLPSFPVTEDISGQITPAAFAPDDRC